MNEEKDLKMFLWRVKYYVSQKFCNILMHASFQHIYHVTEVVQDVVGTHCSW